MSSVGVSDRGGGLAGAGEVGGGCATSSSAAARRSYHHCCNCDRTVGIIATDQLICPNCNGVVLEELGTIPPPPPPFPLRSANYFDPFFPSFPTAGFESDSDEESELSCPLPPPPPPPPPFFTTNSDNDFDLSDHLLHPLPPLPFFTNNSDNDFDLSDHLLHPPPPPPPRRPVSPTNSDNDFNFSDTLLHRLPPRPLSNRSSVSIISGLEIDFSEPLSPDRVHNFPAPPPPPHPLPPIISDRRVHRLPPPPPTSPPPSPPAHHVSHRLPLPPLAQAPPVSNRTTVAMTSGLEIDFSEPLLAEGEQHFSNPRPPPLLSTISPRSATTRGIHMSYPLPPPPPPSPPPEMQPLTSWDYFLPPMPVPVVQATPMPASRVMMEVEDEDKTVSLDTKKITEEMLLGWEFSSQCAVCIDNFEVNQVVRQMPCKHIYHSGCILPWLASHNTCPVCRYRFDAEP